MLVIPYYAPLGSLLLAQMDHVNNAVRGVCLPGEPNHAKFALQTPMPMLLVQNVWIVRIIRPAYQCVLCDLDIFRLWLKLTFIGLYVMQVAVWNRSSKPAWQHDMYPVVCYDIWNGNANRF